MQAPILVCFGKHPCHSQKGLAFEERRRHLVPECNFGFAVVNDQPELLVGQEVGHQDIHTPDTAYKVLDAVPIGWLVEGADNVFDGFCEDGGQADGYGRDQC